MSVRLPSGCTGGTSCRPSGCTVPTPGRPVVDGWPARARPVRCATRWRGARRPG